MVLLFEKVRQIFQTLTIFFPDLVNQAVNFFWQSLICSGYNETAFLKNNIVPQQSSPSVKIDFNSFSINYTHMEKQNNKKTQQPQNNLYVTYF